MRSPSGWDEQDGYDVIGDVHGCADKLAHLLEELGYNPDSSGAYRHPVRKAVFVGDLIDRGPQQAETLDLVKAMTAGGHAQIVMGNHEFNALCYATPAGDGSDGYLRPHTPKNLVQHEAFLALPGDARQRYLDWFMTFPLWLDLGGLRVVHACWHGPSMAAVEAALSGDRFTTSAQLVEASDRSTALYAAIEVLLKGPEIDLRRFGLEPFLDKESFPRHAARVKWWDQSATNLIDATVLPAAVATTDGRPYLLPNHPVDPARLYLYRDPIPVVYGHYWRTDTPVHKEDWTANTACVDFSAVRGGTLVAYRWRGESEIDPSHYHPHGSEIVNDRTSAVHPSDL